MIFVSSLLGTIFMLHFAMQQYQDISGNSGISRFSISAQSIVLEFSTGGTYLYSYKTPGKKHVEAMKHLALAGQGLATYVNQYVRENYERRIK